MRRPGLLLLLGLVIAVVVWIAWPGTPDDAVRLTADEERRGSRSASLHANGSESDAQKPALVGRGEEKTREPERGDVDVLVRGRHGQPLPNVPLVVRPEGPAGTVQSPTDGDGRTILPDVTLDGSVSVRRVNDGYADAVAIAGTRVTLRLNDGIPIRLALVDAETGKPGPRGRWSFNGMSGGTDPRSPSCGDTEPHTVSLSTDGPESIFLRLDVVGEGVGHDERVHMFWVSKRARSLVLRYPIRREALVYAKITEPDGSPTANAHVLTFVEIEGTEYLSSLAAGEDRVRIHKIPFYSRVRVSMLALQKQMASDAPAGESEGADATTVAGTESDRELPRFHVISGLLPANLHDPLHIEATLTGPGHVAGDYPPLFVRPKIRPPFCYSEKFTFWTSTDAHGGWVPKRPQEAANITVQVLRRDGSVHAGDGVTVFREYLNRHESDWEDFLTNDNGLVSLKGAQAGRYQFRLIQPGTVETTIKVDAPAGGSVRAVLQEANGGKVSVRVVDPWGRGLPFAKVYVESEFGNSPTCWESEDRGIQRIDNFTDHLGCRLYQHVDPGMVSVRAAWADRKGKGKVRVIADETAKIEIVLRPPK